MIQVVLYLNGYFYKRIQIESEKDLPYKDVVKIEDDNRINICFEHMKISESVWLGKFYDLDYIIGSNIGGPCIMYKNITKPKWAEFIFNDKPVNKNPKPIKRVDLLDLEK